MKHRATRRILWWGLACLGAAGQATLGATHFVASHGDDGQDGTLNAPWRTIQYAITNAAVVEGDHIHVGGGWYSERVVFPAATNGGLPHLTLRGGYDTNDWSWAPTTHPTVIQPPSAAQDAIVMHSHSNTLAGLTLTGANRGLYINLPDIGGSTGTISVVRCIITNNVSHGLFHDGVIDGRWNAIHAENVLIANNGGDGVRLNQDWVSAQTNQFLQCTIAYNGGHGISDLIQYGLPSRIINSIIAHNGGAGMQRTTFSQYSRRTTIANTIMFNNAAGSVSSAGVEDPIVEYHAGVLFADPGFVGNGDYRLQAGSLAIGAGRTLADVTEDLDGAARTAPYDLGAYASTEAPATRHAETYVDAAQPDDSGDGTSPATAKRTIAGALALTAPDGICRVAAGLYTNEVIMATHGVTLEGAGAENTILAGAALGDTLILAASNLTVRGVTIQDGRRGILLSGNVMPDILAGLLIEDCTIRANRNGVVAPFDNEIRRVYTLSRCRIVANTDNGILHVGIGWPGNFGKFTVLNAINCLIADNGGDGVQYNVNWEPPTPTYFLHCTIANNGGSGYRDEAEWHASVYFTNCIVSGNGLYGVRKGTAVPSTEAHILAYSCIGDNPTNLDGFQVHLGEGTLVGTSPQFEPGGYTLSRLSPAVDSGIDMGIDTDLLGTLRPQQAGIDMGALERIPVPLPGLILTVY